MNQHRIKTGLNIVLAITLLLIAVYAYGLFHLEQKSKDVDATYSDVLVQLKKQDDLQVARNVFRETSSLRTDIDSRLIKYEEIPEFLASIEALASSTNVARNINLVSTTDTDALAPIGKQSLQVSFSVAGNWNNVFHFLSLVETLPYKIDFNTIDLAKHSETEYTESGSGKDKTTSQRQITNWTANIDIAVVIHKKQ